MRNVSHVACFAIAFSSFILASSLHAQNPSSALNTPAKLAGIVFDALTASSLHDDSRLAKKKVRIDSSRIYVGELLQEWGKQSGIALEARDDGKDLSGRWRVAIRITDATLADAMDALRSALSEQGLGWQWQRTGTAPDYHYRLIAPAQRQVHNQRQYNKAQAAFEAQLALALQSSEMSPEEQNQAAQNDSTGVLYQIATSSKYAQAIAVLASSLSRDQRSSLRPGPTAFVLPASALNTAGKKFVAANPTDKSHPTAELSVTVSSPSSSELFRTFYVNNIAVGLTPEMTRRLRNELAQNILLSGDRKQAKPVPGGKSPTPNTAHVPATPLPASVFHRSLPVDVDFVACPPQAVPFFLQPPIGCTVEETRDYFHENNLPSKWRNDLLLFHYTTGFMTQDDIHDAPPQALRDFVRSREKDWLKDKIVPLPDLIQAAQLGESIHWRTLITDETTSSYSPLHAMIILRPTIALMAAQSEKTKQAMLSSQGARIDTLSSALLKELGVPDRASTSARIHCQVSVSKSAQEDSYTNTIEWILTQDTKQIPLKTVRFVMQ